MRAVSYFCSTIGMKQLMGATGLMWCGFVFAHMAGNLLLLVSAEAYNKYSHALISNPAIYLAEGLLVLTLLVHIVNGIRVSRKNRAAKGPTPGMSVNGDKGSSFAVKTMVFQGVLILFFVVTHLITFKFGTVYETQVEGVAMRDLYRLVVEVFQNPGAVAWYVAAVLVLGLHLSHGFYSSFQTLGIHHPSYNPKLKCLGHLFAIAVTGGFLLQPLYIFFAVR